MLLFIFLLKVSFIYNQEKIIFSMQDIKKKILEWMEKLYVNDFFIIKIIFIFINFIKLYLFFSMYIN